MDAKDTGIPKETRAQRKALARLALRGGAYAVLARAFSYPDDGVVQFLQGVSDPEVEDGNGISSQLCDLLRSARGATARQLQSAYAHLLDPLSGPCPYEAEWGKLNDVGKAQLIADVMGFYRAFGVEPSGDRPDHIAAELEFMYCLTLKEQHALRANRPESASLCRDAQKQFFSDHLMTWGDSLLDAMRNAGDQDLHPVYGHLARLFESFMSAEREELTCAERPSS
jgi:TorA maturation chaperone TorD